MLIYFSCSALCYCPSFPVFCSCSCPCLVLVLVVAFVLFIHVFAFLFIFVLFSNIWISWSDDPHHMSTRVTLVVPAMHLARCTPNHAHMCVSRAANICRCSNGSPKTGAACTKHGAAMCSSCNRGFTINTGQTKCSGAWRGLSSRELCLTDLPIYLLCSALLFCSWYLALFLFLFLSLLLLLPVFFFRSCFGFLFLFC